MTFDEIRGKYELPEHFYMISNQFHKHKNHKVVFEAVAELKKKGIEVSIGITGRFPNEPDSPYMQELHDIINKNDLRDSVKFLGLIPRGDQLLLMKYSKAIIQPSLFEGWSTVIEDARSLQVPVIAANLDVNIEQLQELGTYFEPHDVEKLVSIMEGYPNRDFSKDIYEKYDIRMKNAAHELLSVFK
jgi:glycosyltransferase involved in cell wall biosynthesis